YPLLRGTFLRCVPTGVAVLDPAPFVAARFADWLQRHPEFNPGTGSGRLRVLCSGEAARFAKNASRYLGAEPPPIEHVSEHNGRLAFSSDDSEPAGQFVRK